MKKQKRRFSVKSEVIFTLRLKLTYGYIDLYIKADNTFTSSANPDSYSWHFDNETAYWSPTSDPSRAHWIPFDPPTSKLFAHHFVERVLLGE